MLEKFNHKYRIPSARLQTWDYGSNASYFITICTKDRVHFFGEILFNTFTPTAIGNIAAQHWLEIPQNFPYMELGAFIVMPNHIHGILIIRKTNNIPNEAPPNPQNGGITSDNNPMLNDTIGRIIRWYKGRCTFEMRKLHADFAWQPRFYDHIIRDEVAFERIQNYIINNPSSWWKDTLR
jgi:REP element-mobilizing transposase RayT